jgi:hypothetical protein
MSGRPTSDSARRQLKLATQRTVQMCGGQDSAAMVTRVGRNTLSDYANTGNERHKDSHMPVDVLADLMLDCRDRGEVAPLLVALCELAGGTFVRVPEPDRSNTAQQLELAAVGRRLWSVSSLISGHLAADLSTAEFKDQALPQITAVMNDFAALRQELMKIDAEAAE